MAATRPWMAGRRNNLSYLYSKILESCFMPSYIAAYDISHNSSRAKIAARLKQFGQRIQKSVFQVELEKHEVSQLKREVGPFLAANDRFNLIPIDRSDRRQRVSWQQSTNQQKVTFL